MNAKKYPHFLFWFIGKLSFSKTKKISLILFSHNSPGTSSNGMKINEFPVTKIQTHQLQYQSRGQSDDCITSPHQWRRWRCWQVITNDPKKMVQRPLFRKQKNTSRTFLKLLNVAFEKTESPPKKKLQNIWSTASRYVCLRHGTFPKMDQISRQGGSDLNLNSGKLCLVWKCGNCMKLSSQCHYF